MSGHTLGQGMRARFLAPCLTLWLVACAGGEDGTKETTASASTEPSSTASPTGEGAGGTPTDSEEPEPDIAESGAGGRGDGSPTAMGGSTNGQGSGSGGADGSDTPEPGPDFGSPTVEPEPIEPDDDDEPQPSGGAAGAESQDDGGATTGGANDGGAGNEPEPEPNDNGEAGDASGPNETPADAGAPVEPPLDSFRLAVIGSSTAAGEGASDGDNAWVNLLEAALADTVTTSFEVRNFARGGTTSNDLVPGSGSEASIDEAIDSEPNLILVALAGSNDLSAGTSSGEFIERLDEMRDAAESAGIPAFFVSTAPKDLSDDERETLRDWAVTMGGTFDPCWVPIANQPFTPCYIDVFDALASDSLNIDPELGSGDGIHLNDEGHRVIYEIALTIVAPYVCSATACE